MNDKMRNALIAALDELTGEQVRQLFTDFHGCQLLTKDFAQHCVDEGLIDADAVGLVDDDNDTDDREDDE